MVPLRDIQEMVHAPVNVYFDNKGNPFLLGVWPRTGELSPQVVHVHPFVHLSVSLSQLGCRSQTFHIYNLAARRAKRLSSSGRRAFPETCIVCIEALCDSTLQSCLESANVTTVNTPPVQLWTLHNHGHQHRYLPSHHRPL